LMVCLLVTAWCVTRAAAAAPDAGFDRIAESYRSATAYQATIDLDLHAAAGGWDQTHSATTSVWFDRNGQRLALHLPGAVMAVQAGKLVVTFDGLDGHHLEQSIATPVTYEALTEAVPELAGMIPAHVALLTSPEAATALNVGDQAVRVRATPQHTLASIRLPVDAQVMGVNAFNTATYTTVEERFGPGLDNAVFTQDVSNSTGHPTFGALRDALMDEQAPQAAAGGAEPMGTKSLKGKDAPNVNLPSLNGKNFNLAKHRDKVVVFDFWATWCPPCVKGLPKIQAVHDWAKEEGLPVYVLPINLREEKKDVKQFWDKHGLTMHTLMDKTGQAARAYQVRGIPTTVIVYNGKVFDVHVGLSPNLEQELKDTIKKITDKIQKASVPSPLD